VTAHGYWIHPAAVAEIDAAGEWYDAQLPGLSIEFLDAIDDAITLIVERPDAWSRDGIVAERVIRRFIMRRFPFSLVYYVVDDVVRVVAMAHAKRQPRYWSERLRDPF
jgi:toxin ParE1/3/4